MSSSRTSAPARRTARGASDLHRLTPEQLRRKRMRERKRRRRRRNRRILLLLFVLLLLGAAWGITLAIEHWTATAPSSSQSQSAPAPTAPPVSQSTPFSTQPQSESTDVPASADPLLILANKDNPLPADYAPDLAYLEGGSYQMQSEAAAAFDRMKNAANATGLHLMACSTYRSVERQTELFNAEIQKWMGQGMDEAAAREQAATVVMVPGCSEHNTGLAVDVGSITNQRVEEDFENEPEFAWLQEHAAEYGFILRYPADKVEVTGVTYEPWHYRYVGVENAQKIKESGLCLEEYLAQSHA